MASVMPEEGMSWTLSGRFRLGGGNGGASAWCIDFERKTLADAGSWESLVPVEGLRSGCVGGAGTGPELTDSLLGNARGTIDGEGCGGFKVALATCSREANELDADEGVLLGGRRRGTVGVSSVSDVVQPGLEGLILRVLEAPEEVLFNTRRTRSRSSCSSARLMVCPCLLASRDCLISGLMT